MTARISNDLEGLDRNALLRTISSLRERLESVERQLDAAIDSSHDLLAERDTARRHAVRLWRELSRWVEPGSTPNAYKLLQEVGEDCSRWSAACP